MTRLGGQPVCSRIASYALLVELPGWVIPPPGPGVEFETPAPILERRSTELFWAPGDDCRPGPDIGEFELPPLSLNWQSMKPYPVLGNQAAPFS